MKKLLLVLLFAFVLGCQQQQSVVPSKPIDVASGVSEAPSKITEKHNGLTFLVKSGQKLNFSFDCRGGDYFYSVSKLDGNFEIVDENFDEGQKQTYVIQCNSGGSLSFEYALFTDTGKKTLSTLKFGVKLK